MRWPESLISCLEFLIAIIPPSLFAFHFIGHPGLGAFVRAPIAVWAGGEEEVVNGTSVLSELGMRE